ncbi:2,4'-dihydroxyacetophenone dioxygenase family protein [Sorangium sp. So ce134]
MTITNFSFMTDGLSPEKRLRNEYAARTRFDDERYWVPYSQGWFQACHFNVSTGGFSNVLRLSPGTKLPAHYHISTVHGWTIQGTWYYEEHKDSWIAHAGTYIFEPPGELHTLVVPKEATEPMMAFFALSGGLVYANEDGSFAGYDDGFTLLALARKHYRDVGLDPAELDKLIR